jgi:hypothetical protein
MWKIIIALLVAILATLVLSKAPSCEEIQVMKESLRLLLKDSELLLPKAIRLGNI